MIWLRKIMVVTAVFLAFSSLSAVRGLTSGGEYPPEFTLRQGEWYDSWGFNRNYHGGSDGFIPNVAFESLGAWKEKAYGIGEWFKANYPRKMERAEAILSYVQRWTDYGFDEDNVRMDGKPQQEWAWNADEMAHMFNEDTLSVAIGDCEDMSFLCSTIYLAAGFDVVLVTPPEHVALMIWLPEYSNANYYWDISDGRGEGWIWVEATGAQNPLGWTPPDFANGDFYVYWLSASMISNVSYKPHYPRAEDDVVVTVSLVKGSNVSQVQLHYSINGGAYTLLAMSPEGSSYRATIPKQVDGTVVKFYASVTDTEGAVAESAEFSYTVGIRVDIPGFPFESIVFGLAIGLMVLTYLTRKSTLSTAPSPMH